MDSKKIVENINVVLCENSGTSMSLDSLCLKTLRRMGKKSSFIKYGCPKIPGIIYDETKQEYMFTYPIANCDLLEMYSYILVVVASDEHGKLLTDPRFQEGERLFFHLRCQILQVVYYLQSIM